MEVSSSSESTVDSSRLVRRRGFQLILVGMATAHFGTSWTLWTPQAVFPQIPMVTGFVWPDIMAWSWLGLIMVSLLGMTIRALRKQITIWPDVLFLISVGALILEDQHRLQPWVVHYLWVAFLFAVSPPKYTLRLILILTGSIYFYSAISKFNDMFLEQHGVVILSGLFQALNLELQRLPQTLQSAIILGFPLGELLIVVGLMFRKTRRLFAFLAVVMHALLIATFSSRGLNHEWSVLLWNLFFLIQAVWLWLWLPKPEQSEHPISFREVVCIALALVIWIFPVFRLTGHFDQWAGWSLYSPRADVVRIFLAENPQQLGEDFPDYTREAYQLIGGEHVPYIFLPDRWSLAELHVPLNPESRLELATAKSLAEKYDCWDQLLVIHEVRDLSNPEAREVKAYSGRQEIEVFSHRYLLPTQSNPRFPSIDSP